MSATAFSWPRQKIRRPNTRLRVSLRLEDWPEADRASWLEATREAELFDDPGSASHLKPRTRTTLIDAYGRWLGYLAATEPGVLQAPPADRVSPERIECFCRVLAETNSARSGADTLKAIRHVLRHIASDVAWTWLLDLAKRIEAQARPRPKAARLRLSDELYQLGFELMNQAEKQVEVAGQVRQREGLLYRDGLLIALLAAVPIRRSNGAALRIGTTLVRTGQVWTITLPGSETKNGRALEYPVPARVCEHLEVFLVRFRPQIFGSRSHDGLWASAKGIPMLGGAIYDAVCRRTKAAFGRSANPHLFRDAAATFWCQEAPEAILGMRDLLGHERIETTDTNYRHAQTMQAAAVYSGVLERRLRRGPPSGS